MNRRSKNAIALYDKYVLFLLEELKDPIRRRVFLLTLIQDIALEASKLADRKNFELIASLVSVALQESSLISVDCFKEIRSLISKRYRGMHEIRASNSLYSLRDFERGELSVRSFLTEKAWKGLPGFGEEWDLANARPASIRTGDGLVYPLEEDLDPLDLKKFKEDLIKKRSNRLEDPL